MVFLKKNWLNSINNQNFGEYLNFIESNVFEVEIVLSRYNKTIKQWKNKIMLSYLRASVFIFAFLCCPLILAYLSLNNSEVTFYVYIELICYLAWVGFGVYLLKKSIFSIISKNINLKEQQRDLKYAVIGILEYGQSTVDAFFNKDEDIRSDYFKTLNQKQLSGVKKGLNFLEFDLTVFHDISHKNIKCNKKTLILDDSIFVERREFSQFYLNRYYLSKISSIK